MTDGAILYSMSGLWCCWRSEAVFPSRCSCVADVFVDNVAVVFLPLGEQKYRNEDIAEDRYVVDCWSVTCIR